MRAVLNNIAADLEVLTGIVRGLAGAARRQFLCVPHWVFIPSCPHCEWRYAHWPRQAPEMDGPVDLACRCEQDDRADRHRSICCRTVLGCLGFGGRGSDLHDNVVSRRYGCRLVRSPLLRRSSSASLAMFTAIECPPACRYAREAGSGVIQCQRARGGLRLRPKRGRRSC
jgi:hypothetical protein